MEENVRWRGKGIIVFLVHRSTIAEMVSKATLLEVNMKSSKRYYVKSIISYNALKLHDSSYVRDHLYFKPFSNTNTKVTPVCTVKFPLVAYQTLLYVPHTTSKFSSLKV